MHSVLKYEVFMKEILLFFLFCQMFILTGTLSAEDQVLHYKCYLWRLDSIDLQFKWIESSDMYIYNQNGKPQKTNKHKY